jgi:hypothetical protein
MAEQDWTPSSNTLSHLQNLVKHGFIEVVELEAYRVAVDPVFPVCAEGYIVSFMVFYMLGFGMPLHWFLHSLLWYYGHELYHLTPSGVLHIMAFMNLCEAYLGIDPELDLWKYFCVRHPHDPEAELMIFGSTVIHVKAGME